MFSHFDLMFDSDMRLSSQSNYPPYNIVKTDKNKYDIEVALQDSIKDINVEVETGKLTIQSVKEKTRKIIEDNDNVLHKHISKDHLREFGLLQMM